MNRPGESPTMATPVSDPPVLLLEGVRKAFRGHLGLGRAVAVDGLSLEVHRGEVFGLLGPNGAGKTTTLKLALGLLRPDRGRVRLFGLPPTEPASRARTGFLPEQPYFYDYLTARELLDFYGRLRGLGRAERQREVGRLLERVGLAGREGLPLRKLSKGTLQRVGIAQALLADPDLVILDEPMSGLDPIGRREVRDLILSLRREGRTVFFSSHILQDAEMLCDRVAILDRGRAVQVGRLAELVGRSVHWFEVTVVGANPEGLPAESVAVSGEETLFRVTGVEELSRLLAAARAGGGQVVSVWPRRQTLEDLFLEKLGREKAGRGTS